MRGDSDLAAIVKQFHHFPAIAAGWKFFRVFGIFESGLVLDFGSKNTPRTLLSWYFQNIK